MNPYPKGLSNAVLGQSAPTSAGKVSTHFNSPYMKAISQNLMTAIYGSPQDELTRQQIAASKMSMKQTQAEMDTSAAQAEANRKLGELLGDPRNRGKDGRLTPEARAAGVQLSLAAGNDLGSMFVDTGEFGRTVGAQNNQGDINARAAEQDHQNNISEAGLDHGFAMALADMNNRYIVARDSKLNDYAAASALTEHGYTLVEGMQTASNDLYRDNNKNAFTAGQNDANRNLTATTAAANAILGNKTNAAQAGSIGELFGIDMGGDLTESLAGIQPNTPQMKGPDLVRMINDSSEGLWRDLNLDPKNSQHTKVFAEISKMLARELEKTPNDPLAATAKIRRMITVDDDGDRTLTFEPYSGFSMDKAGQ